MADNVKILGMPPESGRWMMVIVGIIIQLCLGAIYAYGAVRGDISGLLQEHAIEILHTQVHWI